MAETDKGKGFSLGKRAKISQAQQYMILAVLGASMVLGAAIALNYHFFKEITYRAGVISKQDEAIVNYSNTIKNIGICEKPKGSTYSVEELKACDPNDIDVSKIPDTLRSDIIEKVAANSALNSVPKEGISACVNPETKKNYTSKELDKIYDKATNAEERSVATQLIKVCSALRVVPDALPAYKNEEALLSSLNQIFIDSGLLPESLSPTGEEETSDIGAGVNGMSINLSLQSSDMSTTMKFINNVERSIRNFDIKSATIEWASNELTFKARASAYYVDKSTLSESTYKQPLEGK